MSGHVAGVVLGAGRGARLGAGVNKVHLELAGEPILVRAARAIGGHPHVDELHVVAAPDELEQCAAALCAAGVPVAGVVAGGATRHGSEVAVLEALAPRIASGEVGIVLIHDGARPLVDAATIARTVAAARAHGGAIAAVPVPRALAEVADGVLGRRVPADGLWRAQTPQAFAAAPLLAAYRTVGEDGSDTASAMERRGTDVHVVRGAERNLKVTWPADLPRAEALLRDG
jgi:2-C-methyl-D-erythritol 4-phosphate cytidylyltransferase